jgi:hypothetical protein
MPFETSKAQAGLRGLLSPVWPELPGMDDARMSLAISGKIVLLDLIPLRLGLLECASWYRKKRTEQGRSSRQLKGLDLS